MKGGMDEMDEMEALRAQIAALETEIAAGEGVKQQESERQAAQAAQAAQIAEIAQASEIAKLQATIAELDSESPELSGILTDEESVSFYEFINEKKNLLDHIDDDNNGISGIEKSFDKELKITKDLLRLTVDADIQFLIREELLKF